MLKYTKISNSWRAGTKCFTLYFLSRSFPFLKNFHILFYTKVNDQWVKYISDDLIFYLTPRVLAFRFMDDGAKSGTSIYLHTKGFTFADVYKLAGMLHYVFGLIITVKNHENRPIIYVKS